MGADTLQALADFGYYNGETPKPCEYSVIEAFVPGLKQGRPNRGKRPDKEGRFALDAFDCDADVFLSCCEGWV